MRYVIAPVLLLAAPLAAQPASAPFTVEETGQGFATLDDAVQSIRMGTATILIAPGVYKQCTVQAGGNITFKAVQPGTAIFDGRACEGKRRLGGQDWLQFSHAILSVRFERNRETFSRGDVSRLRSTQTDLA